MGKARPQDVSRLKSTGVKRLIEDSLKVMGIRGKLAEGKRRHEFQADHGFRKFFKSVCERKMKSLHVEMLLGHNVGLADNYYRPKDSELLEEYLKAVPELTVFGSKAEPVSAGDINALGRKVNTLQKAVIVLLKRAFGKGDIIPVSELTKDEEKAIANAIFMEGVDVKTSDIKWPQDKS